MLVLLSSRKNNLCPSKLRRRLLTPGWPLGQRLGVLMFTLTGGRTQPVYFMTQEKGPQKGVWPQHIDPHNH
ncbi:hypothetical protein VZT92_010875 [Zoarces viviparus]|uniref:Uncharacterized protein n=1 Tax=Zoarces viviparus TaxID=48416 RepID=A0AAW1F912_ZOAVI